MSIQIALDNIKLQPCTQWGHTEYSMGYHTAYLKKAACVKHTDAEFHKRAYDALQFGFHWHTHDGLLDWAKTGRVTDMGHAEYASDGTDKRQPCKSPFETPQDIWAFDALSEYGLPNFEDQVTAYEQNIQMAKKRTPHQLTTGGYYKTIVSGAIQAFGWEMLLVAAADARKMEKVFDSFFRRTLFHMEAWAQTSVEVVIQHDDFVWTQGPFMYPEIYRQTIIPRYAELWKPIHKAGKKVLFCSDGNFTCFVDDLAEAGADGFIFEPCVNFGHMAEQYGQSHCLIGSFVDCRDLTFGTWDAVQNDIDRTLKALENCKGAILAVGNHLPVRATDQTEPSCLPIIHPFPHLTTHAPASNLRSAPSNCPLPPWFWPNQNHARPSRTNEVPRALDRTIVSDTP